MNLRTTAQANAFPELEIHELIPETRFGVLPPHVYEAAVDAYLAYQNGVFDEAPLALEAYLEQLRNGMD